MKRIVCATIKFILFLVVCGFFIWLLGTFPWIAVAGVGLFMLGMIWRMFYETCV